MCGTNIIVSSTDSGLEAFSHNPADDSFAPLPARTGANTKYLNERFLSFGLRVYVVEWPFATNRVQDHFGII